MSIPYDRILALGQAGKFREAHTLCQRLVKKKPGDRRAWLLLGNLELQLGQAAAAQKALQRALALGPANDPEVLGLLGVAHSQSGDLAAGIDYLRQALGAAPTAVETRYNLALALQKNGEGAAAQTEYETLVQQEPHHGRGWLQLGHLARHQNQWLTAESHYQRALTVEPALAEAHLHRGMCRWEAQDWDGARQACERAIALQPTAAAHNLLGAIYERLEQAQPALHHYRQALSWDPQQPEARLNLANAHRRLEDFANAAALYEELLQQNPHNLSAVDGLLQVRMQTCTWNGITELWERFWQELPQTPASISPLSALYLPGDAHQQKIVADKVSASLKQGLTERRDRLAWSAVPPPAPQLRLGYLSGDFRYHAVAHLMAGLFAHHDRTQFQVYAYSLGPDDDSEYRQKLQRDADVFRDLRGQNPEAIAQTIHQDGIHLLIDLAGYTDYGSPQTLLLRPAPIQVHYLGYPGTLGLTDYLMADPVVVPPDLTTAYLEAIAYLPRCYQINHNQQPVPTLGDRAALRRANGLPEDGLVFCCFNHARKINAEIFAVWLNVLRAVPDSVLWLMAVHPLAQANLGQAAEQQGVRGDRLVFAPSQPKAAHLQRLTAADLFLDTPIYNAHTTGSDALWAGVPLLTLQGQTFAARVGESLVRATFPEPWAKELVATDFEDYPQRAIALAQNLPQLRQYQDYLHQQRRNLPLFQTEQTVRD
jgi:predicted O-linked N-acetylglucosamine transferase (SPINDLY family)